MEHNCPIQLISYTVFAFQCKHKAENIFSAYFALKKKDFLGKLTEETEVYRNPSKQEAATRDLPVPKSASTLEGSKYRRYGRGTGRNHMKISLLLLICSAACLCARAAEDPIRGSNEAQKRWRRLMAFEAASAPPQAH